MDGPPQLSGETLIVHHIPLVHCQVSGGRQGDCGNSLRSGSPFSPPENLGLSRTTSLPERDVLQREALLYSSLIHTSSSSWSSHSGGGAETKRGGSTASGNSSFTSSISEEQLPAVHTLPRAKPRSETPSRHNPFLLHAEEEEEEEEEEDHSLSGYLEDSSFLLHSDTSGVGGTAAFHLHHLDFAAEPFVLHGSEGKRRDSFRGVASDLDSRRCLGSSGSNTSMDCGEQDWADDNEVEDQSMRCGRCSKPGSDSSGSTSQLCSFCDPTHCQHNFPDAFSDFQPAYGSDSSCNSSDGVLVNFSAIFNKMNNGIREKPARSGSANLNLEGFEGPGQTAGAFYLDLHTSPTEPLQPPPCLSNNLPVSSTCSCSAEYQGALDLDANCNSSLPPCAGSSGELATCLQSQARLVVATQNYYKLVTCDVSSQSSASPAGSSANSCSDEHSKGSPTPTQPNEYFLFKQRAEGAEPEDQDWGSSPSDQDEEEEKKNRLAVGGAKAALPVIEGKVYVNVSPPTAAQGVIGGPASSSSRPRSRSYDRNLDRSPSPRLGSRERMLSCPMRLSEGATQVPPTPPRVTSFAEIARSKRRNGGSGGSPSQKAPPEGFSSICSNNSHSSLDFSPILEGRVEEATPTSPAVPFIRCYSQGSMERQLEGAKESPARGRGGVSSSSEVVRYSKEQRPTTLPIQPFTFYQQFMLKPPQPKPPLLSGMQARSSSGSGADKGPEDAAEDQDSRVSAPAAPLQPVRLSPLGSYSPVGLQGAPSSGTCSTCTPSPRPPHGPYCQREGGPSAPKPGSPPTHLGVKRGSVLPPMLPAEQGQCLHSAALPSGCLSPQNYQDCGKEGEKGPTRTQNVAQSDFLPEYFSLTEKPPEEFCLSPDASSSSSHIAVDLTPKRALVKAVNTAVDLIVAHFGTSRNPDVKAKLGNSWVSPNVGHLILKYLCPALRDVLQDGLKAHVLDLIIGQRRCQPWSVVEASTQPGPSTRLLHSLFSRVSQFPELSSAAMRLNAFVFGLLNLKCLEFWFSHLHTHEDIIAVHYSPWGLLPLSGGACRDLFEELLLLLQPLALLPFDLDLLFEPHLLQRGQEHLRHKEQLCSAGQSTLPCTSSTLQLMRGRGPSKHLEEGGAAPRRVIGAECTKEVGGGKEGAAGRCAWTVRGAEGPKGKDAGTIERTGEGLREKTPAPEGRQDRQAGWWFQLMQSSQVYIDPSSNGCRFVKADRRKRSVERPQDHPPPRVGVVEGAESSREGEGRKSCGTDSAGLQGGSGWMGSPPESVVNQEDPGPDGPAAPRGRPAQAQSLRWGRLFGGRREGAKQNTKPPKSRPPSGWLGLDGSVLDLVALTVGPGSGRKAEPPPSPAHTTAPPTETRPAPFRGVRALCHHIATEPGQLSFNKGDVMQVLSRADPDWLLCSLGSSRGLVPIVYVTPHSMEDSQEAAGATRL
ncbi:iporin-like isoform X2 [Oryzias latipes]|uniref:RUN and SH3 domain containing 2 n=1 Tax=Oryzias latipes TaxID=8090 RepID=A0A3B3H6K4_ORYLA|nr:iporin-like isoform X2 [Oryzias latipes]